MILPETEVKNILVTAGAGVYPGPGSWPISIGTLPDNPNQAIAIYPTPGLPANPKFLLDYPRWQIVVRDNPQGWDAARLKAREVSDALIGLPSQTLNGTIWVGIYQVTEVFLLRKDDKDRPLFASNWKAIIEPPDEGGNRIPL